jgi:hypothetical protein
METRFNELPENAKKAFERVHNDFKKPMRDGLDEIARAKLVVLEQLEAELRRTQLAVIRLESRQQQLQSDVRSFHEEAKTNLRDVHRFGTNGLQQIQNRGGLSARGYTIGERLPTDFYIRVAEKVEQRLVICMEEIRDLSQQISAAVDAVSESNRKAAQVNGLYGYGQQARVGAKEIVQLIKHQSEAFQRVAANVAAVHEQAELLKNMYLSQNPGTDPFDAADREEAARARIEAQRLRDEEDQALGITSQQQQQQQQQQAAQQQTGGFAPSTTTTTTGGFGSGFSGFGFGSSTTPAPSSSTPATGGFGFGAGATSAAPASFGGFGASSAVPAAAGGGTGAFGTPSGTAAGSTFGGFGAAPTAGSTAGFGFGGGGAVFGAPSASTPTTTTSSAFGLGAGAASFGSSHGVKALDLATPTAGFGAPSAGFGFGGASTFGGFSTATHAQDKRSSKKK